MERFYGELAEWWPLISPAEEYAEEAAAIAALLVTASIGVHEVLELGSGGGSNAFHLKARFKLTLADRSEDMLAVSRRLNPECEHVQGDMRSLRLGRSFDAVFVHDAVEYMTTEQDLALALETAFQHCRPGGIAIFLPDCTAETFAPETSHGGTETADGRGARYLEWSWDPDPRDTWALTEYAFVLRDADGSVRSLHETHRLGVFARDDWLRLLTAAGFEASSVRPADTVVLVGRRPAM